MVRKVWCLGSGLKKTCSPNPMITAELAQKRGPYPPKSSLVDLSIELLGDVNGILGRLELYQLA